LPAAMRQSAVRPTAQITSPSAATATKGSGGSSGGGTMGWIWSPHARANVPPTPAYATSTQAGDFGSGTRAATVRPGRAAARPSVASRRISGPPARARYTDLPSIVAALNEKPSPLSPAGQRSLRSLQRELPLGNVQRASAPMRRGPAADIARRVGP